MAEIDDIMALARMEARAQKPTLDDFIYFAGITGVELEDAQERLIRSGLRSMPDHQAMCRAHTFFQMQARFEFQKEHMADYGALLKRLRFAEWLKARGL